MKNLMLSVMLVLLPVVASAAEIVVDIAPSQLQWVRIHTTHHSVAPARRAAILNITGLGGGCTLGVWFDAAANPETYSMALAAYATKANFKIGYEPTLKSPWNDGTLCALTYLDVK